ncbi:MAG: 2-phospho-L-lactate transferase CofD family protein [Myxococcota bacterium]
MLNVVVFNGGRGASTLIKELLVRPGVSLTSIVNAYDDGKSTGEIRRFFNMLGPSDIRKVQELMLPMNDVDYALNLDLFQYRFRSGATRSEALDYLKKFELDDMPFRSRLIRTALRRFVKEFTQSLELTEKVGGQTFNFSDCSVMNCIYAGAYIASGRDFHRTIKSFENLFGLRGRVLLVNSENRILVALRENGDVLYDEASIVETSSQAPIERIYLLETGLKPGCLDSLSINEKRLYLSGVHAGVGSHSATLEAIEGADVIVYAAGTPHSSLYPTYMSAGLAERIAANTNALKVLVTNIKRDNDTSGYNASHYVESAYRYLSINGDRANFDLLVDAALVNFPNENGVNYVSCDSPEMLKFSITRIVGEFEHAENLGAHDGAKIVERIFELYEEKNSDF